MSLKLVSLEVELIAILLLGSIVLASSGTNVFAQTSSHQSAAGATAVPSLKFDVVSIRLNKSGSTRERIDIRTNTDSIFVSNMSLLSVIGFAYGFHLPDRTFGLPDWAKSEKYDIEAKVIGDNVAKYRKLTNTQHRLMLQSILEDRFALKAHFEPKEMPVYSLTVRKTELRIKRVRPGETYSDGPKGADGTPIGAPYIYFMGAGNLHAQGVTMAQLATTLSQENLGRQVVDETGLTGKYDFSLQWDQHLSSGENSQYTASDLSPDAGPSIFTAVRDQLGLDLRPEHEEVQCLVVDHVDRPSPN